MSDQDDSGFYVIGGTLPGTAVSYVQRQADETLYQGLIRHEYCYVLTSRQMGKSSLMVRTAARLREAGVRTAVVDLTALGQNLTVDQWYKGILNRIGQNLGIEASLDEFWYAQESLPPLERWLTAVQKVVLMQVMEDLIIFIDEIDMVRSLPFRTDEFFAGIRACYNRREDTPELGRLTFCLLGVASPADLVKDNHITPFNIGRRIELNDFTPEEAAMLGVGISVTGRPADRLMARILYWTGGQPYLTQRLCAAVAADERALSARDVDRLCEKLFFARGARQTEANLAFVGNRILKSEQDVTAVLDLYRRVLTSRRSVEYDPIDPLCEVLSLSAVIRTARGRMLVRNRIYAHVFDRPWVESMIPDDLRRQRRAYRTGLFSASSVGIAIVAGALAWRIPRPLPVGNVHDLSAKDLGSISTIPRSIWLNSRGVAVLGYTEAPTILLDSVNGTKTPLKDIVRMAEITDSGYVAGCDTSIHNENNYPMVCFNPSKVRDPVVQIIQRESRHSYVRINSKGHIMVDNAGPDYTPTRGQPRWCVYDPAQHKIIVTAPLYFEEAYLTDGDELYGMQKGTVITKYSRGISTPFPHVHGDLMGVTNAGDILTEDSTTHSCQLQCGPLGAQSIPEFEVAQLNTLYSHMNSNGCVIGSFKYVPELWCAGSGTRYNLSVIDGWHIIYIYSINDSNQIVALASKQTAPFFTNMNLDYMEEVLTKNKISPHIVVLQIAKSAVRR